MARLAGLMTATVGFSAATFDGGDGAATEVAEMENPHQNVGALLFEGAERVGQSVPPIAEKGTPPHLHFHVAHPPWSGPLLKEAEGGTIRSLWRTGAPRHDSFSQNREELRNASATHRQMDQRRSSRDVEDRQITV